MFFIFIFLKLRSHAEKELLFDEFEPPPLRQHEASPQLYSL